MKLKMKSVRVIAISAALLTLSVPAAYLIRTGLELRASEARKQVIARMNEEMPRELAKRKAMAEQMRKWMQKQAEKAKQ